MILTLPFTLITLGLFLFVVNAICLALTAALVPGFEISGFLAALVGALIVTVVSWILSASRATAGSADSSPVLPACNAAGKPLRGT